MILQAEIKQLKDIEYNLSMKIFPKITFLLLLCIVFQGSGYVGEPPNINDYFQDDRQTTEQETGGFIDIHQNSSGIMAPPSAQVLKRELAPMALTPEQIKILRPAKRPEYYDDLIALKPSIDRLKASVKSPNIQDFASCINVQKFYFDDFLNKYKNSPLAKQDVYAGIKDVNLYAQSLVKQWNTSEENIKYVSYSSFNGAYQPSVIKDKLIILDKKIYNLAKLVDSAE